MGGPWDFSVSPRPLCFGFLGLGLCSLGPGLDNKLKSFLTKALKSNSLEVIWAAHVRHPSVIVISQVRTVAGTLVKQIICPLLCPKVSEENVNSSLFYTWCFISDTLSVLWWRVGCWIADFVRLKSDCWGCNASSYQEPWVEKYAKVRRYLSRRDSPVWTQGRDSLR